MPYDQFEYYYPMPDDVAQSILIAETESKINLRPTNLNAKKLWLYNKLLKNFITNRKTIVSIDSVTDAQIIYNFLKEHGLENLAFFFQHSRSNLENALKNFAPLVFNGRLLSKELSSIHEKLFVKHDQLQKAQLSLYGKSTFAEESLLTLLIKSIKLKQELSNQIGFTPYLNENLTIKDYYIIKQKMEDAISVAKGSDPALSPFNILNDNLFELFDYEEAWLIIQDHILQFQSMILSTLNQLIIIDKENIRNNIIGWQNKVNIILDIIYELNDNKDRSSQDTVKLELAIIELNNIIPELCADSNILSIDSFLKLNSQQINHLIFEKISKNLESNLEQNNLIENEKIIDIELRTLGFEIIKQINSKNILQKQFIPNNNLKSTIEYLKDLSNNLQSILKLKHYFNLYFNWRHFLQTNSKPIRSYFESLSLIPANLWPIAIEYTLIQRQILLSDIDRSHRIEQLQEVIKSLTEKYKSTVNNHILSKYESNQHKACEKLILENIEFNKLLNLRKNSDYTLSDYYCQLSNLSQVFPLIILDNIKEDYVPISSGKIWDEFIDLKETPNLLLYEKMSEMSFHSIQLNSNPVSETVFNIALHQSPPEVLKNILNGHVSETAGNIKNLVNFIFSNKPKFQILVNSNEFIISFLPIELTKLFIEFSNSSYNIFEVDEMNHHVRMNDWLAFKGTVKKIWTIDHLIEFEPTSIQQNGWQKHFIKCLIYAGFDQINFSSSIFLNVYNIWDFPNNQMLFTNGLKYNKAALSN